MSGKPPKKPEEQKESKAADPALPLTAYYARRKTALTGDLQMSHLHVPPPLVNYVGPLFEDVTYDDVYYDEKEDDKFLADKINLSEKEKLIDACEKAADKGYKKSFEFFAGKLFAGSSPYKSDPDNAELINSLLKRLATKMLGECYGPKYLYCIKILLDNYNIGKVNIGNVVPDVPSFVRKGYEPQMDNFIIDICYLHYYNEIRNEIKIMYNQTDGSFLTHEQLSMRCENALKFLLNYKADPNACVIRDNTAFTPILALYPSQTLSHLEMLKILLAAGADPTFMHDKTKGTDAFCLTCKHENFEERLVSAYQLVPKKIVLDRIEYFNLLLQYELAYKKTNANATFKEKCLEELKEEGKEYENKNHLPYGDFADAVEITREFNKVLYTQLSILYECFKKAVSKDADFRVPWDKGNNFYEKVKQVLTAYINNKITWNPSASSIATAKNLLERLDACNSENWNATEILKYIQHFKNSETFKNTPPTGGLNTLLFWIESQLRKENWYEPRVVLQQAAVEEIQPAAAAAAPRQ